ncbi:MAG: flagellum-specific ATP synthase FliI, partial [Desulfobulbaceae bacterium]|nr:flagellum-specific ATP synthase FliI [Desulfobulbaceae bacterium]
MNLSRCIQAARDVALVSTRGRVSQVIGMVVESLGPAIPVGSICEIDVFKGKSRVPAEVVGFREGRVLLMPLAEMRGIEPGSVIRLVEGHAAVPVSNHLLGRIIDGLGHPMDGKGPLTADAYYPLYADPL